MSIVSIQQGKVSYGAEIIFEDLYLELKEQEKVAIIGRNGCGKSTLLKVLSEQLKLDKGQLFKRKGLNIGYLAQFKFEATHLSVKDSLFELFKDLHEMEKQLSHLEHQMADDHALLDEYAKLRQVFEHLGGYSYQHEMMRIFTQFGFIEADLQRPIGTFSGGQQTRLAMVHLLLSQPDVLLLDEPTNHLDVQTIEWLENYLKTYPKAIIFVSHDRSFIDKVAHRIIEMELGSLTSYVGNYEQYQTAKLNNIEKQASAYQRQQKDIERLEVLIEKFRYKKSKAKFAQSKIKYLDRMEKIDAPKHAQKSIHLHFYSKVKGGKEVLRVKDLVVGYEQPLLTTSFTLQRQDHLALVGPNGQGKSSLMKTLLTQIPALGGEFLFGHQIQLGYFDQQQTDIKGQETILEYMIRHFPLATTQQLRSLLAVFLFQADDVFKSLDVLSGGEKVRLIFAKLMNEGANVLILDEPTNHLDIDSKEALEKALLQYDGTLIFATHDRYFIQKLAKKVLTIDEGEALFSDSVSALPQSKEPEVLKVSKRVSEKKLVNSPARIMKQIARIEQQISTQEEALQAQRALRFEPEYYHDYQKMHALDESIDAIHSEIALLMKDWEILNESLVEASQEESITV